MITKLNPPTAINALQLSKVEVTLAHGMPAVAAHYQLLNASKGQVLANMTLPSSSWSQASGIALQRLLECLEADARDMLGAYAAPAPAPESAPEPEPEPEIPTLSAFVQTGGTL